MRLFHLGSKLTHEEKRKTDIIENHFYDDPWKLEKRIAIIIKV